MLWIFRDIKSGCFSDSKTCYEIPAPLRGLVFVRFAPENFDAANAVLRMTLLGGRAAFIYLCPQDTTSFLRSENIIAP